VDVGGTVEEGDPVCFIEVMKLFTSINADRAARIVSIPGEDGQFVDYGQKLLLVEPQ
jgi:acetyl-CoA carboxylase biotin carboxyl carrier protein